MLKPWSQSAHLARRCSGVLSFILMTVYRAIQRHSSKSIFSHLKLALTAITKLTWTEVVFSIIKLKNGKESLFIYKRHYGSSFLWGCSFLHRILTFCTIEEVVIMRQHFIPIRASPNGITCVTPKKSKYERREGIQQFQLVQQSHLAKLPILNTILLSLLSYSLKNPISLLQIEDNSTYLYLLHLW